MTYPKVAVGDQISGRVLAQRGSMTDSAGIPNNITASLQKLTDAATELNAASDTLGAPIEKLAVALQRLNLGVEAWAQYASFQDERSEESWDDSIGYTKFGSQWGIGIRHRECTQEHPDEEHYNYWPFNDAPRAMRLEAIDHLPALVDALIEEARDTANRIKQKVGQAQLVADAIALALVQSGPVTPKRK